MLFLRFIQTQGDFAPKIHRLTAIICSAAVNIGVVNTSDPAPIIENKRKLFFRNIPHLLTVCIDTDSGFTVIIVFFNCPLYEFKRFISPFDLTKNCLPRLTTIVECNSGNTEFEIIVVSLCGFRLCENVSGFICARNRLSSEKKKNSTDGNQHNTAERKCNFIVRIRKQTEQPDYANDTQNQPDYEFFTFLFHIVLQNENYLSFIGISYL